MAIKDTKVVTGVNTRFSYFNGWEPVSINGSKERYSVSVLIPKSDTKTINAVHKAVDAAIEDGLAKFGGKKPNKATLKLPLRDGDVEREDEAYKGHYFINANSTTAPQIVDNNVQPILDRSEVYSGCYGRVSLNFYAFNSNGNKGIACGLGNIQKLRDGEPLGVRSSASDDFTTEEDEEFLAQEDERMNISEILNLLIVLLAATYVGEFIITELVDLYVNIREKLRK